MKMRLKQMPFNILSNAPPPAADESSGPTLSLFVQLEHGAKVSVDVSSSANVEDLTEELKQLLDKTGEYTQHKDKAFKFTFAGKELKADKPLSDQDISAEATIEAEVDSATNYPIEDDDNVPVNELFADNLLAELNTNYEHRMIQRIQVKNFGTARQRITTYVVCLVETQYVNPSEQRYYVFKFHNNKCQLLTSTTEEGNKLEPYDCKEYNCEENDILDFFASLSIDDEAQFSRRSVQLKRQPQEPDEHIPGCVFLFMPTICYILIAIMSILNHSDRIQQQKKFATCIFFIYAIVYAVTFLAKICCNKRMPFALQFYLFFGVFQGIILAILNAHHE